MQVENLLLNDEYWFNLEIWRDDFDEEHDRPDDYDDYWADYGRDEIDDDF